jgi:hypothetical protein
MQDEEYQKRHEGNFIMPSPPTSGQQKYGAHHDPFTLQSRILDLERDNEELRSLIQNLESRLDKLDNDIYSLKR